MRKREQKGDGKPRGKGKGMLGHERKVRNEVFYDLGEWGEVIWSHLSDPVDLDRNRYPGGRPHQMQRSTAADKSAEVKKTLAANEIWVMKMFYKIHDPTIHLANLLDSPSMNFSMHLENLIKSDSLSN